VISAGVSMYTSNQNAQLAEGQANTAKDEAARQEAKLDKQKAEYRRMTFKNPFQDMENVYEDLTVNQQQAQFQAQQGAQQRADIMQNLQGAAGGSGIAGSAQALANQGALQTQRISASIGQQESRKQLAMAKGAAAVQTAERQGEQWVQQAEMDRQATLLGMQMGASTGANLAQQQAQANQMNAQIASTQALVSGVGNLASTAIGAYGNEMFPGQDS